MPTVSEIAKHLQGEVVGDGSAILNSFAPAARAQPGDLTFAENEEFFARAENSAATAIIADQRFDSAKKILILVPNARIAFAKALALFFPEPAKPAGIHPLSVVAASASVDPTAHIGPHCTVGERVKIGARCVLQAGNFIGDDSTLADEVNLFPNVTIYPRTEIGRRVRIHAGTVIGSDGFGYVLDGGFHRKVPQIGNVIIGDDVEIGANVTIDRGALGPTIIGKGTKIDNLVQIAHNVEIGEHCIAHRAGRHRRQHQARQLRRARRPGRHRRPFEDRQPGHRRRAGWRDDRRSRKNHLARRTRAAGQRFQAPGHCAATAARFAQAHRGVRTQVWRQAGRRRGIIFE